MLLLAIISRGGNNNAFCKINNTLPSNSSGIILVNMHDNSSKSGISRKHVLMLFVCVCVCVCVMVDSGA